MTETFDRGRLRGELERDEGRRQKMYEDSLGVATIGIGHQVARGLPDPVIDLLLDYDIDEAQKTLDAIEPRWRDLDPDRQRVLLNLAFNLGPVRLVQFHRFWQAIGDFLDGASESALNRAADELLNSRAAAQTAGRYNRLAARLRPV